MLVISRRVNEKIVFPDIKTAVQVVGIRGRQVRLGIESPPDVAVVREELQARSEDWKSQRDPASSSEACSDPSEFRHALRNRVNEAGLSVALLRLQLQSGRLEDAEETLSKIEEEFRALQQFLEPSLSKSTV